MMMLFKIRKLKRTAIINITAASEMTSQLKIQWRKFGHIIRFMTETRALEICGCFGRLCPTDTKKASSPCYILVYIHGLSPGAHGFHIHEYGDLTDGCNSTGPHYNPSKKRHGGRRDNVRHLGDLGNIVAGKDGFAYIDIWDKRVRILGPNNVIGRSVVVHANEDDLETAFDAASYMFLYETD
ncbi:copper/zinc superoxide dismutase [Oesophagostomum dentatum]|uniref:Copper/zinc superoxide dismutase n=1 Tax=Oesophagostomum dentatum TaxID=61180 RepID=A0A0B1TPZ3_OESDE|nr:copper/zinc superoxide dismutase [Oesophagostomum dentatum]